MELIRGTTPTIEITITDNVPLDSLQSIWVYVSQRNRVKIDKLINDVTIDSVNKTITLDLTQKDTLSLSHIYDDGRPDAIFQIRLLFNDGTAMASNSVDVYVLDVYKDGVIT